MVNYEPIIFCLILILILGISHGALDNLKGKKLLYLFGYRSLFTFYFIYILISILIVFLWVFFPNTVLLLFLVVAAYHFGKEDTVFSFKEKFLISEFLYFLKGSAVIFAPLLFQREKTNESVSGTGIIPTEASVPARAAVWAGIPGLYFYAI